MLSLLLQCPSCYQVVFRKLHLAINMTGQNNIPASVHTLFCFFMLLSVKWTNMFRHAQPLNIDNFSRCHAECSSSAGKSLWLHRIVLEFNIAGDVCQENMTNKHNKATSVKGGGFVITCGQIAYARLRLRASPATPRRSRSPEVGSGTDCACI